MIHQIDANFLTSLPVHSADFSVRKSFKRPTCSKPGSSSISFRRIALSQTSFMGPSFSSLVFTFATFLIFATCDAKTDDFTSRRPEFELLHPPLARTEFITSADDQSPIILLQENGSVDTVKYFFLKLTDGLAAEDVLLVQDSSNFHVLNLTSDDNMLLSSSGSETLNITCSLSFDSMVGKTEYTLKAVRRVTNEEITKITIPFIIVGMTFYTESIDGTVTILSGDENGYYISFQEALKKQITESSQIRVFIQLPDGSSVSSLSDVPIPNGETLQSLVSSDFSGQFQHTASQCDVEQLGNLSPSGRLVLPTSCGYGFYSGFSDDLCFGIDFQPYRAGNFSIQFSWSGLTALDPVLAEEVFESVLHVFITGDPPVAILGVFPAEKLWRPEGGEIVQLEIINAMAKNVSFFQLLVANVPTPFSMVYGSFSPAGAPHYSESISFSTEPGAGSNLNWTLEYRPGNNTVSSVQQVLESAVTVPGFDYLFNYDSPSLRIDSLSPDFGEEEGGTEIAITGYFPFFNPDVDGLFFSGVKLERKYFISVSSSKILILLPPKSALGGSYEFKVNVKMGNAVSNEVLFSFIVKNAVLRISQSGTSEIDEETFRIGNCTAASFTAIVTPFTTQVQSFKWKLHRLGNANPELLSTSPFQADSNASAQTLLIDPNVIVVGAYTLKVSVVLLGKDLEKEILLVREYVVSIGAFILEPPTRSVAIPDAPLRLSAIVRPPGKCYTGNQTMMFEWTAFGKTQVFSSTNATGSPVVRDLTTTPARLGWEYVVPRKDLRPGNQSVIFKVWMAEDALVSGQALSYVIIQQAPLVPVIRFGEEQVSVNYLSTLVLFSTRSYDPDVLEGDRTAGLTYEWQCQQSSSKTFPKETSSVCPSALLPSASASEFSVPIRVLESEVEIAYLQYSLVVRKGMDRVSSVTTLVVEIQNGGSLPFIDDYQILLLNDDGIPQSWNGVAHFERAIISVSTSSQASWTYSLLEPNLPNFFSSANLIDNPHFFSADTAVFSVSGNTKPLGIEAGKLRPLTTYKFRILFEGSQEYETTSVIVTIRTAEAPTLSLAVPSVTNGTTDTTFTAIAGIPNSASFTAFSYFFIITDESGNNFCIAGCTGYNIAHFRIGRAGNYSLSVYILDMQGKALIDSKTLSSNITILDTDNSTENLTNLATLFESGDDNTWTQLAHDLALILLERQPTENTMRMLTGTTNREESSPEDLLAVKMQFALSISEGSRKIFCSSYPNSYHGSNCMSLSSVLTNLTLPYEEILYNIMITVQCCVENTPLRTTNKMGPMFPMFVENLNSMAATIDQGGNSRRRLLQSSGDPPNLIADVKTWASKQLPASVTSGQLDGYSTMLSIGEDERYGHMSVVVASNPGHLPVQLVNGEQRRTIVGPSEDELFFATGSCLSKLFSPSSDSKRLFVLYSVDNFVIEGFQDPPKGSNLADRLYWQQVFEQDAGGRFIPVELPKEEQCFCWRLPILRRADVLENSVEYMAGMYSVSNLKKFGVDVLAKGDAYTYVYEGQVTSEYSVQEGWVEACQDQIGMVGSTLVSRTAQNAIGDGKSTVLGTGGTVIVGLVVGGLLLAVVALASAWVFVTRAVSDVTPLAALAPNEFYVERDIYGRGTIFDVNPITVPSTDQ